MLSIRRSVWSDVSTLASDLRAADRAELAALGTTPPESLADGYLQSTPPYTAVDADQVPVAMFGVVPLRPQVGAIWLLGTDRLVEGPNRVSFLRLSRKWVPALQRGYEVLTNLVDKRNTVHLRWLEWCGFAFVSEHEINGYTFIKFERHPCAMQSH